MSGKQQVVLHFIGLSTRENGCENNKPFARQKTLRTAQVCWSRGNRSFLVGAIDVVHPPSFPRGAWVPLATCERWESFPTERQRDYVRTQVGLFGKITRKVSKPSINLPRQASRFYNHCKGQTPFTPVLIMLTTTYNLVSGLKIQVWLPSS